MRRPAITLLFTLTVARLAAAQDGTWTNMAGGNWSDSNNWLNSTVATGLSGNAYFSNTTQDFTVTLNSSPWTISSLMTSNSSWTLSGGAASAPTLNLTANLSVDGGTVIFSNLTLAGQGGGSYFAGSGKTTTNIIDNCTVTNFTGTAGSVKNRSLLILTNCTRWAGNGRFSVDGASTVIVTGTNTVFNGYGQWTFIGNSSTQSNLWIFTDGAQASNFGVFQIGANGAGSASNNTLVVSNGAVFTYGGITLSVSGQGGNQVIVGGTNVVTGAPATLNLAGGSITIGQNANSRNDAVTLNTGGLLTNGVVNVNATNGMLYLNGGVLAVSRIHGSGTNYIQPGGALFNYGTNNISVSNVLADAASCTGNVIMLGSGTLTLHNTNTYSGATVISNGLLQLTGAETLNTNSTVTISAPGRLGLPAGGATQTVAFLTIDGVLKKAGSYTSSTPGMSAYLAGPGELFVTGPPPDGTVIIIH